MPSLARARWLNSGSPFVRGLCCYWRCLFVVLLPSFAAQTSLVPARLGVGNRALGRRELNIGRSIQLRHVPPTCDGSLKIRKSLDQPHVDFNRAGGIQHEAAALGAGLQAASTGGLHPPDASKLNFTGPRCDVNSLIRPGT
jgi:hypothetical protein